MNKTVLKMHSSNGESYQFTYKGHMRYSPNCSSTSGYGSDDWYYLCEHSGKSYMLHFEVNSAYGFGCWDGTPLNAGAEEELKTADIKQWRQLLYAEGWEGTVKLSLDNIDEIRHILPTSSRIGYLNDNHYRGD